MYMDQSGEKGASLLIHKQQQNTHGIDIDTRPLIEHCDDRADNDYFSQGDVTDTNSSMGVDHCSKRPNDTALKQQRMRSWQPVLDPWYVIVGFLICGVLFLSLGVKMNQDSDAVVELKVQYDGDPTESLDTQDYSYVNCTIQGPNEGRLCSLTFEVPEEMKAPVLVHYEMGDFYQNHRLYVVSRDNNQLKGSTDQTSFAKEVCEPLQQVGNQTLNPCGLVANTLFNDVFQLINSTDANGLPLDFDLALQEKGIAWKSDVDHQFKQPEGFRSSQCSSCDDSACTCDGDQWSCRTPYQDDEGNCHLYFYPSDEATLYLHEIYPMVVNPLEGVTNEHFIVWMRTASQPLFRKLYGYFETDIPANTKLTFELNANFEVGSFSGQKALILSTTNWLGGKNDFIGLNFVVVGIGCLVLAFAFGFKHYYRPRKIGDVRYLRFKQD